MNEFSYSDLNKVLKISFILIFIGFNLTHHLLFLNYRFIIISFNLQNMSYF